MFKTLYQTNNYY